MAGRSFTRVYNGVGNRIKAEHVNELQVALEDDDARIDAKPGLADVQGVVQTELSNNATVVAAAEDAAAAAVDATGVVPTTRSVVVGGASGPESVDADLVAHAFYDAFSRTDGLGIGTSPSGHVWTDYGINTSSIVDGRMTFVMTGTPTIRATYPGVTLSGTPDLITARISFEGTADTPPNLFHGCTFIVSNGDGGFVSGHPVDMLHINVTPTHLVVNIWEDDTPGPDLLRHYWSTAMALDGTTYDIRIRLDADASAVTITGPDRAPQRLADPAIAAVVGPIVIFEPFYYNTSPGYVPYFNAVSADVPKPDARDAATITSFAPVINLAGNPSFEGDVTDDVTSNRNNETVTRVADGTATDGDYHLRCVTPGTLQFEGVNLFTDIDTKPLGVTGSADPYVGSLDVWGSGTVQYRMGVTYTDTSTSYGAWRTVTLTGTPQRIETRPLTLDAGKTVDSMRIGIDSGETPAAVTINVDSVQIEPGSEATPYAGAGTGTRLQMLAPGGDDYYLSVTDTGELAGVSIPGIAPATERPAWPVGRWMGALFQHGTGVVGTQAIGAGVMYGGLLDVPQDTPIDRIGIEVTTGAEGNLKLAAHAVGTDGFPGALLFEAGPVATTTTTGMYSATVSETLPAGYVLLSVVHDVGVTVRATSGTTGLNLLGSSDGTVEGRSSGFVKASAYATIPNPYGTPTSSAVTTIVNVVVRTA